MTTTTESPAPPPPVGFPTGAPEIGRLSPRRLCQEDPAQPHRRAAVVADTVRGAHHHASGASIVGVAHAVKGTTRQDAFSLSTTVGGRLVVAVADGLGSRASSQLGATAFCEQVTALVNVEPDLDATTLLVRAAAEAETACRAVFGLGGRDVAFVAIVLVADQEGTHIARVGDSSAFTISRSGEVHELFDAPEGPINGVDASFPDAGMDDVEQAHLEAPHPTVVVTTDGAALDLRMSGSVRSWLAERWAGPTDAFTVVDSLRYQRQGSQDDRTAVVVWPDHRPKEVLPHEAEAVVAVVPTADEPDALVDAQLSAASPLEPTSSADGVPEPGPMGGSLDLLARRPGIGLLGQLRALARLQSRLP